MEPQKSPLETFWQRPEGKTGKIVIASLIALFLGGMYWLGPMIIKALQNAIHAGLLLAALGGVGLLLALVWFLATSPKVKMVGKLLFALAMTKITGAIIDLSPRNALNVHLGEVKQYMADLNRERDRLSGFLVGIGNKLKAFAKELVSLLSGIEANNDKLEKEQVKANPDEELIRSLSDTIELDSRQVLRIQEDEKDYQEMQTVMNDAEAQLDELYRICQFYETDLTREIARLTDKDEFAKISGSMLKSIRAILRGSESLEIYNQAAERIRNRYDQAIGDLRSFMKDFKGVSTKIKLEGGRAQAEVLAQLKAMRSRDVTTAIPEARTGVASATVAPRINVTPSPVSTDIDRLLKKRRG